MYYAEKDRSMARENGCGRSTSETDEHRGVLGVRNPHGLTVDSNYM